MFFSFLVTNSIFNGYRVIQIVYVILLEFCSFGFQEIGPLLGKVVVKLLIVCPYYTFNDCRICSFIPDIGALCLHLFISVIISRALSMILIFCLEELEVFQENCIFKEGPKFS